MEIDDAKIEELERLRKWSEETSEIAATLPDNLPDITRFIIAGDIRSGRYREELVRAGKQDAETAIMLTGSYARLDLAMRLEVDGFVTREWLLRELPDLWRGSDPDDTDPRFLALWKEAWRENLGCVRDGKALPRRQRLTVWRGQRRDDPLGIAWTLNREIAVKFAAGAGLRTANPDPFIVEASIPRGVVLAYLTQRGEDEVIFDPSGLAPVGDES